MRISDWSSDVCSSDLADTPKPVSPNMCWMLSSQPSICDDSLFTGTLTRNTASGSPGWPAMVPVGCPSWPTPVWTTPGRSEEHTSELQSLMRISYAVFCLKKKNKKYTKTVVDRIDAVNDPQPN